MIRRIAAVLVGASFSAAAVLAQKPLEISKTDGHARDADAYVYVSARVGDSDRTRVYGFSTAPSGALTPVGGSPIAADVTFLAANGQYLFGSDAAGAYIRAYTIAPDGTLRQAASTSVVRAGKTCDNAGALFVDPDGETVYNVGSYGKDCADAAYQAFQIDTTSGRLELVHEAYAGRNGTLLRFSADNQYAFGADCSGSGPLVYEFIRHHDGSLARVGAEAPLPPSADSARWCPYMAVSAPGNHLVVPVYPSYGSARPAGAFQLATYTVGEDGGLNTNSTAENMPRVAVGEVTDLAMAPAGQLMAVAGSNGLEVFQMQDGSPANPLPGLLTRQEVDQMFWDQHGHLYAISQAAGKLWVFNVDGEGWTPAPGSPYQVSGAQNLAVQPVESQPQNQRMPSTEQAAASEAPDPAQ